MHLFFDTVWKLHIGAIPEKPKKEDHATYLSYYPELFKYNEAIAAIKQNALTVGNPKLIEKIIPVPIGMSYKKDHFYPFKGGFETKEMQYRVSIIDGKGGYTPVQTVAILTLPEEKKNTMENMKWITVRTKKDLPNEKHLYDEESKYVVRVYHDDRGSHIEELTEDEIWEASQLEDGAVCWLKER